MATLELRLDRTTFLGAVYKTQGVVDRKSTSNVLAHVLVESLPDGTARLVSTDYDVTIMAEIPAEVIVPGSACINGKSLFDVVKNLDETPLHLRALPNDWSELSAGRAYFKLAGVTPADFPEMKIPEDAKWLRIPKSALRDLFEKTAFSMSSDETRMNLNGVFFKVTAGSADGLAKLTMVSTDGHRLSKVELEAEVAGIGKKDQYSAIIHKKGVTEVKRLFESDADALEVGFAQGVILFRAGKTATGGTVFSVRQIEDNYPDYSRVIPQSSPVKVVVPRERLARAIRKNAILTSNKTYIIKLELTPGKLAVTASNPDYGEGRDELDVDYRGEGMVVGFNYNYLLDVLGVVKGESVVFEMTDEFSPTVLTSPSEPGAVFVVMPMRV
ncbi:MAG: DNA polymerase III subunit beta [Deltaproteobacteria bacterium]|jgi:DNA polymerase-3 subunit beta|nr:DNA polymerase III subunit beta [Deltaproteobacteria bacterium]